MANQRILFLIRHCQATGQAPQAALTHVGIRQAEHLARQLSQASIDMIISSPWRRTLETAYPLAEKLSLPVAAKEGLKERHLCDGEVDDWRRILERSFEEPDRRWPGGESSAQAQARGLQVLEEPAVRKARCLAVVTHGNLLTLLLNHFNPSHGFQTWSKLQSPDLFGIMLDDDTDKSEVTWLPLEGL